MEEKIADFVKDLYRIFTSDVSLRLTYLYVLRIFI